ncbi:ribonuclease PH [Alkalibacter saccharofermentans]|uniref:Ribonuclease PH n=1 Tax=Alkalibacter saccharofermentans DSM 14828 TaxID=1120975 RepID=A0A1M4ZM82_9FIRM|nr:ribonuclease PH [Alkalibacter saccharofermentans]SHF18907.1 RNAse PH [Alkalibacter saccharofermentans DSM 14828]
MSRIDGRTNEELRQIKVTNDFTIYADGSVLIEAGNTKVICTAMVEEKVPIFLRGENKGWVTAEYNMIPSSTMIRKTREMSRGKADGRNVEIQRLIGRTLRSIVDLEKLGERTLWIDCDVIQADGGTRTASITGAYIALIHALEKLKAKGLIEDMPVKTSVAAVSVGIVGGVAMLDLCYEEDSRAEVDMNIIMTGNGEIIEIQGTGEERPFTKDEFARLMELAEIGIEKLSEIQKDNV